MRTRLAPLITVKQEPLSHDYSDRENANIIHNGIGDYLYGHHPDRHDDVLEFDDLNNNKEFIEDKNCKYIFISIPHYKIWFSHIRTNRE